MADGWGAGQLILTGKNPQNSEFLGDFSCMVLTNVWLHRTEMPLRSDSILICFAWLAGTESGLRLLSVHILLVLKAYAQIDRAASDFLQPC